MLFQQMFIIILQTPDEFDEIGNIQLIEWIKCENLKEDKLAEPKRVSSAYKEAYSMITDTEEPFISLLTLACFLVGTSSIWQALEGEAGDRPFEYALKHSKSPIMGQTQDAKNRIRAIRNERLAPAAKIQAQYNTAMKILLSSSSHVCKCSNCRRSMAMKIDN